MGILVHPNHEAEKANGVGVSTDPIYKTAGTFYLNTQLGADLVTNPNALSVPEEILLDAASGTDDDYFVMNPSNQVPKVPDWTGILVHLPIHYSSFLLEEKSPDFAPARCTLPHYGRSRRGAYATDNIK